MDWQKVQDKASEALGRVRSDKLNTHTWVSDTLAGEFLNNSKQHLASNAPRALEGWVVGVKDLFNVKGTPLTAGAKILEGYISPYESTVTQRLWDAGAICLGKQNLDAFGMGSTTTSSIYGPTLNPHSKGGQPTSAGGSSGGGCAAVAAGLCDIAIGTDTGGSCRQPAAWCGVVGFKPTYGLVSRYGVVAHASSFDCPGLMAQSVNAIAEVLNVIAGFDKRDAQTYNSPTPNFVSSCYTDAKIMKIAVADVGTNIKFYEEGGLPGLDTTEVDISAMLEYCVETYYILTTAEAASNLARYDGLRYGRCTKQSCENIYQYYAKSRTEGFPAEVQRRVLTGVSVMMGDGHLYRRASQIRRWISDQMGQLWKKYDALIIPTTTRSAMTLHETEQASCSELYNTDRCTTLASLVGSPAMSVPIGVDKDGMPLGLQIIGAPFSDAKVLAIGAEIERRIDKTMQVEYLERN
jgi:aspartyl-tRNA(Asn)/glutamyl-tRNA(Gln) amidotransferase subunit A